jgi:phosphoribosylamine--glycine ligase
MPGENAVLVVGSGGREYEITRQLAWTADIQKVYAIPGNAGTELLATVENIDLLPTDVPAITAFVRERKVSLVVIGPADFMKRHGVPQPRYWVVRSFEEALEVIKDKSPDAYVIKADGLAAGKGVVLPETVSEAEETLRLMFSGEGFDQAGTEGVVIQERLHGPEVSAFAISNGTDVFLLPFAQDHKRLLDGDQGPNTGGMGAYTPLPSTLISEEQATQIRLIANQTIRGMASEDNPYQGVLYIGLMLAKERNNMPVVIEYNARFGDPEAEVLLPALSESDIDVAHLLMSVANGEMPDIKTSSSVAALTVCLAAAGYPEAPRKGDVIVGLDKTYENVIIHHAGTKSVDDNTVVTNGGRVLYVTGFGANVDEAAAHAYAAIGEEGVHFEGMQYRTDIGHQARTQSVT